MNADERECLNELARTIIGACYEVSNVLGAGFLEKVYERALAVELRRQGVRVETQVPLKVTYKGEIVGDYAVDILVEGSILIELKCVECFANEHMAQCINYLTATGLHLAILVNFQRPKVERKRIVRDF